MSDSFTPHSCSGIGLPKFRPVRSQFSEHREGEWDGNDNLSVAFGNSVGR